MLDKESDAFHLLLGTSPELGDVPAPGKARLSWNTRPRCQAFGVLMAMAACCAPALAGAEAAVKVSIEPQPAAGHQIIIALCTEENFPHENRCPVRRIVSGQALEEPVTLAPQAPGRYAVVVVSDVNGNGKLDTNFLGIPKEPVGASHNPTSRFGPPRFQDAAFDVADSPVELVVHLRNVGKR